MSQVIFGFHSSSKYEFKDRIMQLRKKIPGDTIVPLLPWELTDEGYGELGNYEAVLNKVIGSIEIDEIVEKLWAERCEVMYYPWVKEQKQGFIIKEA